MSISTILIKGETALKNAGDMAASKSSSSPQTSYTMNEVKSLITNIPEGDGSLNPLLFNYQEIGAVIKDVSVVLTSPYSKIKQNDYIYKDGDVYKECVEDDGHEPEGIILSKITDPQPTMTLSALIWYEPEPTIDIQPIYDAIAAHGGILPSTLGLEDNEANLTMALQTIPVLGSGDAEFANGTITRATSTSAVEAGYGGYVDTDGVFTPYTTSGSIQELNAISLGYISGNQTYPGVIVKCDDE